MWYYVIRLDENRILRDENSLEEYNFIKVLYLSGIFSICPFLISLNILYILKSVSSSYF